ncbi:molybdenum cofactor guanylyltransferase [Altererythrobacter rubellus]|uniref:Molybdenum cofactor guanylyltransferase n=1 Tax=Altererythrobacter rubellus TaxID=2173831 RepID=A0A9Y2F5V1_9SPHN|nr:molybdenum cofactor guanylyltransferase [Altererythrobacter rubellus]WIW96638.1 molybdenum cofactor guanylyltransferase [Altererythrobacter rubellus]
MKLLGAIVAGGKATRFGSDKAYARHKGRRLIDHVGAALAAQCSGLVVCGRAEEGFDCIADLPEDGLGPLGGLNAALHFARINGFDRVLSSGCDTPNLPDNLAQALAGEGPAIVQDQPIVGLWPASLAPRLDIFIRDGGRALYGFTESVNARQIAIDPPLMNVNRPSDLES